MSDMREKIALSAASAWVYDGPEQALKRADAILAVLSEAGWGPTAAHEAEVERWKGRATLLAVEGQAMRACIQRLRDGQRVQQRNGVWEWIGDGYPEPMTEAEQEVMSRG